MRNNYISRNTLLYDSLKTKSFDFKSIKELYQKNNFKVSDRQIYKDIQTISSMLRNNEELVKKNINNCKNSWYIKVVKQNKINSNLYHKLFLLNGYLPELVKEFGKQNLIEEFRAFLNDKYDNVIEIDNKINVKEINIINTNFNEINYKQNDLFEKFKSIYWCISNDMKIKIKELEIDLTRNFYRDQPKVFVPGKFIVHKNNIYIAGLDTKNKLFIFSFDEIISYEIMNGKVKDINATQKIIDEQLLQRFGIAENMDENIYNIILEFPEKIGKSLQKLNIHKTQIFKHLNNKISLQINCGINKELINWVFSFSWNIKIIAPERLKEIHLFILSKITSEAYFEKDFLFGKLS